MRASQLHHRNSPFGTYRSSPPSRSISGALATAGATAAAAGAAAAGGGAAGCMAPPADATGSSLPPSATARPPAAAAVAAAAGAVAAANMSSAVEGAAAAASTSLPSVACSSTQPMTGSNDPGKPPPQHMSVTLPMHASTTICSHHPVINKLQIRCQAALTMRAAACTALC